MVDQASRRFGENRKDLIESCAHDDSDYTLHGHKLRVPTLCEAQVRDPDIIYSTCRNLAWKTLPPEYMTVIDSRGYSFTESCFGMVPNGCSHLCEHLSCVCASQSCPYFACSSVYPSCHLRATGSFGVS